MTPLVVRARLSREIALPWHSVALDSLLMAAVALRDNTPPLGFGEQAVLQIPLARSSCDRVYLATRGIFDAECHQERKIYKRPPVAEAQWLGSPKLRRMLVTGGPSMSYRLSLSTMHLRDDTMHWFAIGDREGVSSLLSLVHYLGKKRSVGLGRVERWEVEDCEPWEGFPVLSRDGRPLRPLPLDWPGLGEHRVEYSVLDPPYWQRWREEECAT